MNMQNLLNQFLSQTQQKHGSGMEQLKSSANGVTSKLGGFGTGAARARL